MHLIHLIAVMLAPLMVLAGCEGFFSFESPCSVPEDAAEFSQFYGPWLNVPLPASAQNFAARCTGWMDHQEFWLQFDIAPDDLAALQTGLSSAWGEDRVVWRENGTLLDSQKGRMSRLVTDSMIARMRSYVVGVDQTFGNLIVVVNTSDPNSYRVFLYVFRSF